MERDYSYEAKRAAQLKAELEKHISSARESTRPRPAGETNQNTETLSNDSALSEEIRQLRGEMHQLQDQLRLIRADLKRALESAGNQQTSRSSTPPPPPRRAPMEHENPAASKKMHQILVGLYQEVEYSRKMNPLNNLLAAKDIEIRRFEKSMHGLPPNHPDRAAIEELIRGHYEERVELQQLVQQAEREVEKQLDQIRRAAEHGLPNAVPGRHSGEPSGSF
ncbi:hypothetical protein K2X30_14910 [bacterium]|nr:hypothetical protein [bacterium]